MREADFQSILSYGKQGELMAKELFEYDEIAFTEGKVSEYDGYWVIGGEKVFFEVKRDKYMDKTGNICIENSSSGKPSGISTTKADFYLYLNDAMNVAYLIDVPYIKKCIAKKLYLREINCGYKSLSKVFLFDAGVFKNYLIYTKDIKND